MRSSCYSLSLNCFGDKETLIKRIENLLFNNYLHKKPSSETARDLASTDIEIMVKNLKCTSGNFDNISFSLLENASQQGNEHTKISNNTIEAHLRVPEEKVFKHQWPWHVVVELTKMNRNLSYQDIYKGLCYLMRPTMVFYNHFLECK